MLKKTKKNGYFRLINKNTGRLKVVKHYNNGLLNGKIIYYWDNGQIHLTGQYENRHRIGHWKTYDLNGDLILEEDYNRQGQKTTNKVVLFPI